MNNSVYCFPSPDNEPVKSYLKGSPERTDPGGDERNKETGRDSAGGSRNSFNLQYMWNRQ